MHNMTAAQVGSAIASWGATAVRRARYDVVMEHDVIAHIVEDVFGGQIATRAEWTDCLDDELFRLGVCPGNPGEALCRQ